MRARTFRRITRAHYREQRCFILRGRLTMEREGAIIVILKRIEILDYGRIRAGVGWCGSGIEEVDWGFGVSMV